MYHNGQETTDATQQNLAQLDEEQGPLSYELSSTPTRSNSEGEALEGDYPMVVTTSPAAEDMPRGGQQGAPSPPGSISATTAPAATSTQSESTSTSGSMPLVVPDAGDSLPPIQTPQRPRTRLQ